MAWDTTTSLLAVAAVGVWGVAGFFALTRDAGPSDGPAATAEPPPSASAAPTADTRSAAPAATASATATATAAPPPVDTSVCVRSMLAADAFAKVSTPPKFKFLCTETNALKGGLEMRSRIIVGAKGGVSDAMREWAGLDWHEMAAFSTLRARCCAPPLPALEYNFKLVCPLDKALDAMEAAVSARDKTAFDAASADYREQVSCLSKFGQGSNFGRNGPPGSGTQAFDKLTQRVFE